MKTLLKDKHILLIDNEVYFINPVDVIEEGDFYYYKPDGVKKYIPQIKDYVEIFNPNEYGEKITHSTASLQGVKQLDRSLFVKGVDVEELARENCPENYIDESYDHCFKYAFETGFNANKNEWTDQEFKLAISKAIDFGKQGKSAPESIKILKSMLRPLSLPSSIIIEGEEIKQINW